ncbi:MAG: methyltransferase domain-containing protein [Steroidobacteraceae bacterium]
MTRVRNEDWLATAPGRALLETEARVLEDVLGDLVGFETLQVGRWGEGVALSSHARTQRHWLVAPDACGSGAIRASYDALPVASASVEGVVLPHTLEHASNPHEVLREVERVLMGEGQVAVCGINPYGPWGLRHRATSGRYLPYAERLLGEGRLRDWLRLLGFEITASRAFLFVMPWARTATADPDGWFERRGPELMAPLAGAYVLKARKRVRSMTPIRPAWRIAPRVVAGAAEPTRRNAA